jgi:hypothetical protein
MALVLLVLDLNASQIISLVLHIKHLFQPGVAKVIRLLLYDFDYHLILIVRIFIESPGFVHIFVYILLLGLLEPPRAVGRHS